MRIVSFSLDPRVITKILRHIAEHIAEKGTARERAPPPSAPASRLHKGRPYPFRLDDRSPAVVRNRLPVKEFEEIQRRVASLDQFPAWKATAPPLRGAAASQ
jgi:hypothetical protein